MTSSLNADACFKPGRVKRGPRFAEFLAKAEGYEHDSDTSKLQLIRAIAAGADELTSSEKLLMILLIMNIPGGAFTRGMLVAPAGNRLLESLAGWSATTLGNVLRSLEGKGFLIRHIDESNHRVRGAAFDIRCFASDLAAREAIIDAKYDALREFRGQRRHCSTFEFSVENMGGVSVFGGGLNTLPSRPAESEVLAFRGGVGGEGVPNSDTPVLRHRQSDKRRHPISRGSVSTSPSPRYKAPIRISPPPKTPAAAARSLLAICPGFANYLGRHARDPHEVNSVHVLLNAAHDLARDMGVPHDDWVAAAGRLSDLDRAAIVVLTHAKPSHTFRAGPVGFARWMLSREPHEVDVWGSIYGLKRGSTGTLQ